MGLRLVTPAVQPPVGWETAKAYLRLTSDDERILVEDILLPAAVEWCEAYTGRQLVDATWELTLDAFPADGVIRIPVAPLRSVGSIKYKELGGVVQTVAPSVYVVTAPSGPTSARGSVTLADSQVWPPTQAEADSVIVTFMAGYGASGSAVPARIIESILARVAARFDGRAAASPDPPLDEFIIRSFE